MNAHQRMVEEGGVPKDIRPRFPGPTGSGTGTRRRKRVHGRGAGASGVARKRVLFIRNPVFRLCCRDFRGAGRAIRSSLLFRPRPLCVRRRRRLYTCIYPPYTHLFYRCGMAPKGMEREKKKKIILNLGQREKNETLLTREAGSRKTGG